MHVLKFGGTSLANKESISSVLKILKKYQKPSEQLIIIASAQAGVTNQLVQITEELITDFNKCKTIVESIEKKQIELIKHFLPINEHSSSIAEIISVCNELYEICRGCQLIKEISPRTKDLILSFGERLSAFTLSKILNANYLDSRNLIITDDQFGSAKVDFELSNKLIEKELKNKKGGFIVTGFIGSTLNGETTTLGRSGSDYSAAIVGAALDAKKVEIWTDVDGMLTVDPKKVSNAQTISTISYQEALELSHFGAKVIFPSTMNPLMEKSIPIIIKNTFNPEHCGTYISEVSQFEKNIVKGISSLEKISMFNLSGAGMQGVCGIAGRLFKVLAESKINVLLISQASSEHSICFSIATKDAVLAEAIVNKEFEREQIDGLISKIDREDNLAIVAVVGSNIKSKIGIASKILKPLGKNGINIKAMVQGSSEINISFVIKSQVLNKALNVLHQALFQSEMIQLNLFILGTGSIGSKLISIIHENKDKFERNNTCLNIVGLANSKNMIIHIDGINVSEYLNQQSKLESELMNLNEFINRMIDFNLENSIFIDLTAAESPILFYDKIVQQYISIVTANKKANTQDSKKYKKLHDLIREFNGRFYYETNVGAGLPIINTIQNLQSSGDEIVSIKAILSGTINYLLSNYNGKCGFSELVDQAKQKNITEPDPREDLSGMDVARKCLILARECGWNFELEDIEVEPLFSLKAAQFKDYSEFMNEFQKEDNVFHEKYIGAKAKEQKLRYIAEISNEKIKVSLQSVSNQSPFYPIEGTENCISITSDYYQNYPMVIKGPGAGVEVTASGVLADILKIAKELKLKNL